MFGKCSQKSHDYTHARQRILKALHSPFSLAWVCCCLSSFVLEVPGFLTVIYACINRDVSNKSRVDWAIAFNIRTPPVEE